MCRAPRRYFGRLLNWTRSRVRVSEVSVNPGNDAHGRASLNAGSVGCRRSRTLRTGRQESRHRPGASPQREPVVGPCRPGPLDTFAGRARLSGGSGDHMKTSDELATACNADAEFRLAARRWHGAVRLDIGDDVVGLSLRDGVAGAWSAADLDVPAVRITGTADAWLALLAPRPARFLNDLMPAIAAGAFTRTGDELMWWQYYPALARMVEVMRERAGEAANASRTVDSIRSERFDAPTGRYVHLELGGIDHRVYFEEAGAGIPLLLQHTAGSHGIQFRHLFEMADITDRFRLIAYDLPFHGKS